MMGENSSDAKKQRNDGLFQRPLLAHLQTRRTPTFDDVPSLAHLPYHQQQQQQQQQHPLPFVMTPAPDGTERNTYFYDPLSVEGGTKVVQSFAKKDSRGTGMLLLSYFYHYAFEFDWRRQVVSIRGDDIVLKEEKSKAFGWKRHGRLSIEDPFEIGYDVGHVLREDTSKRLKNEFARAYVILSGGCAVVGKEAINMLLEEFVDPVKETKGEEDKDEEKVKVKEESDINKGEKEEKESGKDVSGV
jgi:DNA polymerase sigma